MNKEKQNVVSVWDKVAPTFGRIGPNYWERFGKRLVELSNISEDAKILDIGMGRGASLFSAIDKIGEKGHAIGIDMSETMVRETHKDILNQRINNAEVIKMNAEKLNFNDNCFNNVICGFGIGYILLNDIKLTEVLRVLRQNGQVGFSIWCEQEDQKWLTKIINKYLNVNSSKQDANKKIDIPVFNTIEGIRVILENAGFKNVKVYRENSDVVYSSKEEWWKEMYSNAVRTVFEQIEKFGHTTLMKFKNDVFNGLEEYKREDGLHFNMPVIYAFGEK